MLNASAGHDKQGVVNGQKEAEQNRRVDRLWSRYHTYSLVIIPYVITGAIAVFIWKFMTGSGNKSSRGSSRKKSGPTWVERSINPNYMRNEDDAEAERQRRIRDRRDDERRRQWDEDWAAKRAADRLWDEQHH